MNLRDYALGETLCERPETLVLRATHLPSGERRIVSLPASDAVSLRAIGRLIHEHQILTRLADVPGVARASALEQQGVRAALVLCDPGLRPFDRLLSERGRLPVELSLRLGLGVARALDGVHAAGIMHKDVNPLNVLVDDACDSVVLWGFGIASELSEEATEATLPEALEGSLPYISPEQTGRTARGLDSRTDLYSLGALLFEALSGRPPFTDQDPLALVHAHLAKAPPSLDRISPDIPATVARIVERCLEKHPEKRYQTAKGLAADLERALTQWLERGKIDPFPLGERDFSPKLRLPQTLLGRAVESRALTAAFERAAGSAVEVLLLGGPSGVGKTALVRSVYREIARAGRGLLLSGKHDQLGRAVPYAALAQAFSGLLAHLTASPKPVFEAWRARIDKALGANARVIADLVPEMEWLMGPLPPVPVVPTEMAYNRLKWSWIEFVRAVTDASPPLVLFLDDLQWVDPASVELLKVLLTDVGRRHLLLIAAYRDNEVDAAHPLWELIEVVEASGVKTLRLVLGALDAGSVEEWLQIALSAEPERVRPLARALSSKTDGNPFFLGQLLLELHRQKLVRRDLDHGTWQWDQDAVERAGVTDNVVELVLRKVVELPASTQDLLGQAACAGYSFSLGELGVLSGRSPQEVAADLWPALPSGLVIPSDGQYRESHALSRSLSGGELEAGYRFLHDRVQQAFYERIAPEQRARAHAQIGRRLQAMLAQQGGSNQKQLEMVRHLNLGAAAISGEEARRELAGLNLEGAKAAKANGSYRLQATLLEKAQELLGARAQEEEPALLVELTLDRIEADYMLREFEAVHRRAEALLAQPLPAVARLAAQELRVRAFVATAQFGEGERLGLQALDEQGLGYPESNEACVAQTLDMLAACDAWLDEHPGAFDAMPPDHSPEHLVADALNVATMLCCAFGRRPAVACLSMARNVLQVRERAALTAASPFFIASLANGQAAFRERYRECGRWAREGTKAAKRLGSPFYSASYFLEGLYASYDTPIEQTKSYYSIALRLGATSGSFQAASWGLVGDVYYIDLWRGRPLEQVAERERAHRDLMERAGDTLGQHAFALIESYTTFLGSPEGARRAPGQEWLTASSRFFLEAGDGFVAEFARVLEAHLSLAFGEPDRALAIAEEAERFRTIIYGVPPVTDIPLWRGLAAAKCCGPERSPEERARLLFTLERSIERFAYFSEGCVENFGHKLRLLEAERARVEGRVGDALLAYDEAIEQAHAHGFLHIEALAAQLCAELHLEAGRERLGALYLHQALSSYARWGARALSVHLEAKYSRLLQASVLAAERAAPAGLADTAAAQIDVGTVVHAAQALASELDPSRVVGQLMGLLLKNAGAQRGALILKEGEALLVVARLSVEGGHIEAGLSEPLEPSAPEGVAVTVVRYVARSREPLVVDDAQLDRRFSEDAHLATRTVRSLLALPLTHRGRLTGVLYLEHGDAPSAFPPARVALLSVLASQAAIAVENATLYRDAEAQLEALRARNAEVQQLNDELRRQIEQRSARLMEILWASDAVGRSPSQLQAGGMLGDCYRVVRLIGEGGMGAVYEVERTTDGRRLAAKVLRSSTDRRSLRRFAREARILASLSHPNLISIVDIDVAAGGKLYIVMELVHGSALSEHRARFGDVRWGLCVLRQVAEALAVLHARSVVHRDLKPENILLVAGPPDALPEVKLADFGISVVLEGGREDNGPEAPHAGAAAGGVGAGSAPADARSGGRISATMDASEGLSATLAEGGDTGAAAAPPGSPAPVGGSGDEGVRRRDQLTQTGMIMGTPFYIAPELSHGSKGARTSSDIFSLGIIAFELLTGAMPFVRPPVLSVASGERLSPPPLGKVCPGLDAPLAELFERCLAVDPASRPDARELAAALARSGGDASGEGKGASGI